MNFRRKRAAIVITLFVSFSLARAALLEGADTRFGTGSLTIDPVHQLAWLDLSHSVGYSFNAALQATDSGGVFEGYRHATVTEVAGLFQTAGLAGSNVYSPNNPNIAALIKLLTRVLSVHMAFDPEKLRPIVEAQIARDETMAERLTDFLQSPVGRDRIAIVICGRGHCEYHLGIPDRVARRMPDVKQRVVLFSESDELQLSEAERQQAREVRIPHDFWREFNRLPANFFQISEPADDAAR